MFQSTIADAYICGGCLHISFDLLGCVGCEELFSLDREELFGLTDKRNREQKRSASPWPPWRHVHAPLRAPGCRLAQAATERICRSKSQDSARAPTGGGGLLSTSTHYKSGEFLGPRIGDKVMFGLAPDGFHGLPAPLERRTR